MEWPLSRLANATVYPYLGDRILEVGCGGGGITGKLVLQSAVYSLDVELEVLTIAKERFPDRLDEQF